MTSFFATLKVTLDRSLSVDHTATETAMECFQIHMDLKLQWNVFQCFYLLRVLFSFDQSIYSCFR